MENKECRLFLRGMFLEKANKQLETLLLESPESYLVCCPKKDEALLINESSFSILNLARPD